MYPSLIPQLALSATSPVRQPPASSIELQEPLTASPAHPLITMARRAPARKGKKAAAASSSSAAAKPTATAKRKGAKRPKARASKDVFSDDEEEATHQERAMNARADVDEVFEYEDPAFDQEDSEVDEDEAFNSEDEAAYGMFFSGKGGEEEEEEGGEEGGDLLSDLLGAAPASRLSTASDDEEEADEEKIKNLSKMVDGLVEKRSRKKLEEIDSHFASEAGGAADGELTLGSLLGAQTAKPGVEAAEQEEEADEKTKTGLDLRRVRQQVRELEGDGTTLTLQANREPVHDARAQRKLTYVEKTKEVDVFEPVVRRNRNKETLDLRVQAPKLEKLTPAALASKFVAQTDMEKSVAALLQAGDLTDKKLAKDEEEELARKRVSTEEVAARQKELAKLRSLLFYEEQKQRRVKKIKSKLYHKIRNAQDKKAMAKQTEELRALDPELARKLDEEMAEKRAEERLTLKHRNTSKWVKHQLRRGIQADDATRSAIADQLRRGEELRRKMNTVDSDDDDMDDDDDDDEEGDAASRLQKRLEKQASALVTEIDEDSAGAGKKRGLQGMKFMQRAAEKQREKARAEAERLLREIRTGEGADGDRILSEGEDYLSSGDEGAAEKKSKKAKKSKKNVVVTAQDKAAVERALAGGALQTANVSMSGGVSARASGAIAIDLGEGGRGVALANGDKTQGKELELGAKSRTQKSVVSEPQAKTDTEDADMEPAAEGEENPWLSSTATKSKRSKKNKKKSQQNKGTQADVAAAIESLAQDTKKSSKEDSAIATLTNGAKSGKKRKLEQATTEATEEPEQVAAGSKKKNKKAKKDATTAGQDDLVRRAFEFVAEEEDELAQEKDRLAGQDADAKKGAEVAKLVGMSGWGSWAGDGIRVSKRQIAREQKAKDIAREAKQKALAGRKDARFERVLINEKKDKKAAKFTVKDVPYPFTSREEYEAAMRNPLGNDWNTSQVTNVLTAPKIMKHAGTAIAPLVLSKEDRKQAKKELSLKRKAKF
ncbi:U3 small nucleolar RNA-associated protein 14 A [Phytophthora pseudosyringae]|uniref:U3 small nucleolar RNA-associated protein 14 A n=1 Tax=Phytophthora pseudosyringae TaxID=221518 RepID=A0A8T1VI85_9STRA|nr:U3 small nucleolar RNA-associated protein 14 A [Phytophthora pseudosyringae]